MPKDPGPFRHPIYVTRPLLPELGEYQARLAEVWESQWLTNNGTQHRLLEAELRKVLKVPSISLFNNGTIALIVACQSLRLTGEVITTPFTFPATPHVLTWNGIQPVFCDVDRSTMNIDSALIEQMITPRTTGILAVHVFGVPCDVIGIQEVADRYGLKVVYDAAHAFGAELDGCGIGTFGDISMFSFHATKLFHTAEGGALTFQDPRLKARIDLLKNFGIKSEEEVVMPGINGKMNELQAALGLAVLVCLDEEREKREALLRTYRECLAGTEGVTLPPDATALGASLQYFVIRIDGQRFGMSRDAVHQEFKKFNVHTRKYFFPLCSDYSCYRHIPSAHRDNLPVANRIAQEVLALPFYGALGLESAERICSILKSFSGRR